MSRTKASGSGTDRHAPGDPSDAVGRTTARSVTAKLDPLFDAHLRTLPWDVPIEEWDRRGVRLLNIKRGVGRHPLVFVEAGGSAFAVKQLSVHAATREVEAYRRLLEMGIHTLRPVGVVTRSVAPTTVETRAGTMRESGSVAHSVTLVEPNVLPDSQLFRRSFQRKNRRRILEAIADLFAELHLNGVHWGDASLANTLVKFLREPVPQLGSRTVLKAYLADAETVEFHGTLSDGKRAADVGFFLESMEWLNEDLRSAGIIRDEGQLEDESRTIRETYERFYAAGTKRVRFERETGLSLHALLGKVTEPAYLDSLDKHIQEHKWYLSERRKREVSLREAASDWLEAEFIPVTRLFRDEGVLEVLPGRTASELYVQIMVHKYYMSQQSGKDVGVSAAVRDYVEQHGGLTHLPVLLRRLTEGLRAILGITEKETYFAGLV